MLLSWPQSISKQYVILSLSLSLSLSLAIVRTTNTHTVLQHIGWLRVSFCRVAVGGSALAASVDEILTDPIGVRLRLGPYELPPHLVLANVKGGSSGSFLAPPSSWVFPISRAALSQGGLEVEVVDYFSGHMIGWLGIPLKDLMFVHHSITFGQMRSYRWSPVWRCRGEITLGLKLTKRRTTSTYVDHPTRQQSLSLSLSFYSFRSLTLQSCLWLFRSKCSGYLEGAISRRQL